MPQPKKDSKWQLNSDIDLIKAAKGEKSAEFFPFTPAQEFTMLEIDGKLIQLRDSYTQSVESLGIGGVKNVSGRSLRGQVLHHLALSFNDRLFSDCKIQTATESLFLHRIVLSSSPVLAEALALDVRHLENGSCSVNAMACLGLYWLVCIFSAHNMHHVKKKAKLSLLAFCFVNV